MNHTGHQSLLSSAADAKFGHPSAHDSLLSGQGRVAAFVVDAWWLPPMHLLLAAAATCLLLLR
jgi:hypothetical protein